MDTGAIRYVQIIIDEEVARIRAGTCNSTRAAIRELTSERKRRASVLIRARDGRPSPEVSTFLRARSRAQEADAYPRIQQIPINNRAYLIA